MDQHIEKRLTPHSRVGAWGAGSGKVGLHMKVTITGKSFDLRSS